MHSLEHRRGKNIIKRRPILNTWTYNKMQISLFSKWDLKNNGAEIENSLLNLVYPAHFAFYCIFMSFVLFVDIQLSCEICLIVFSALMIWDRFFLYICMKMEIRNLVETRFWLTMSIKVFNYTVMGAITG